MQKIKLNVVEYVCESKVFTDENGEKHDFGAILQWAEQWGDLDIQRMISNLNKALMASIKESTELFHVYDVCQVVYCLIYLNDSLEAIRKINDSQQ